MTKYARIENGIAVEIFVPPKDVGISHCFHEDVVALFTNCPENIKAGDKIGKDGFWTIADAVPEVPPAPVPFVYSALTPLQYYLAFTVQERIAIKASTDPILVESVASLDLIMKESAANDPPMVHPSRKSTQDFLKYLVHLNILTSVDRIDQISRGEIQ